MDDCQPVHERGQDNGPNVDNVNQPVHERNSSTITQATVTQATVITDAVTTDAVIQPVHERGVVEPIATSMPDLAFNHQLVTHRGVFIATTTPPCTRTRATCT